MDTGRHRPAAVTLDIARKCNVVRHAPLQKRAVAARSRSAQQTAKMDLRIFSCGDLFSSWLSALYGTKTLL